MAYSVDTRKIFMDYLKKGHTQKEANAELNVSIASINKWQKMLRETGSLEDKEPKRKPRKLHDEELKAHIAANPDAYFTEIAKHFNCSDEGVRKACKRLGITRKKKTKLYKERDEEKRREYKEKIESISP